MRHWKTTFPRLEVLELLAALRDVSSSQELTTNQIALRHHPRRCTYDDEALTMLVDDRLVEYDAEPVLLGSELGKLDIVDKASRR